MDEYVNLPGLMFTNIRVSISLIKNISWYEGHDIDQNSIVNYFVYIHVSYTLYLVTQYGTSW
jgi:hypothetical protein